MHIPTARGVDGLSSDGIWIIIRVRRFAQSSFRDLKPHHEVGVGSGVGTAGGAGGYNSIENSLVEQRLRRRCIQWGTAVEPRRRGDFARVIVMWQTWRDPW